jgi:hypothetical protein
MNCTICKYHGGNTLLAKEGSENFRRTAWADHGSSRQHSECLENSFMKKSLEKMRERLRLRSQMKDAILLRLAAFIARENLALDKFKTLCLLIEDIFNTARRDSFPSK